MRKRYSPPEQRAQEALEILWNAAIEMSKKSRIEWGDNDDGDPDYDDVMLTLAKLVYGLCESSSSFNLSLSDAYDDNDKQVMASAAKAFQEIVNRLNEKSDDNDNVVLLPAM